MDEAENAVKPRKAPATIMKERIEAQEAEIARLKALVEGKPSLSEGKIEAVLVGLDVTREKLRQFEEAEEVPVRSRANTERGSRRARGHNDLSHQMKLGVGFKLDEQNFEYRWINGGLDDQRLRDKTRAEQQGADWSPLTSDGKEPSDSTGTVLRRAVGTNQAGQVEYAYLCRKPKDLYEEDQGVTQALNDKRMQAIHAGKATAPGESAAPDGLGYGQHTEMTGQGRKAIPI